MRVVAIKRTKTRQLKKPVIAPYHQTSESPGFINHKIAVTKPDNIMKIENTKPCCSANLLLIALREIVPKSDDRKRQPAKPASIPSQNTPVA